LRMSKLCPSTFFCAFSMARLMSELSMGTSQDYRVAAEEGATYVRLGSALWASDKESIPPPK